MIIRLPGDQDVSLELSEITRLILEMKIVGRDDVQRGVTWGRDLAAEA